MARKRLLETSVRSLCHPASLAAMAILLVNDLLLKQLWPSWWTGKLSDLVGLFFIPFLLAALLAWLVPGRSRWQERVVAGSAFGITAIFWIFAKLDASFNQWVAGVLGIILPYPVHFQCDPSDLLALLSLPGSAWLWWHQKAGCDEIARPETEKTGLTIAKNAVRFPPWSKGVFTAARYFILPTALLLLLADAAMPDVGIRCLEARDGVLLARTSFKRFSSQDGGLTWLDEGTTQEFCPGAMQDELLVKAPGSEIQYRIRRDQSVERSTDGGQTWTEEVHIVPLSEAEKAYLRKQLPGNILFEPLPLDAVIDPASGNLVLAMGHQGVYIRKPDGQWLWVAVGEYQHNPLAQAGLRAYSDLLGDVAWLALAAGLLTWSTLLLRFVPRRWWRILLLALGWVAWGVTVLVFPPALTEGSYVYSISSMGIVASIILAILTVLLISLPVPRLTRATLLRIGLLGLAAGILFILPYGFWVAGIVPAYSLATLFAVGLVVLILAIGLLWRSKTSQP